MRRRRQVMTKLEEILIDDAYRWFLEEKTSENLSPVTLETYKLHIRDFIDSMELEVFSVLC